MATRLDLADILTFSQSYGERRPPQFVVAATLAGELGQIIHVAKRLSLSSKNARVITVRAGEWGRGFSGITQFIDEYARRTIMCAERINQASSELSRRSIRNLFMDQVVHRLARVIEKKREKSESIVGCHRRLKDNCQAMARESDAATRRLGQDIAEIRECTRALSSLVAICRIEASRAGPFQEALGVIASEIELSTERLLRSVNSGQRILEMLSGPLVSTR
ncbi:MAG: hypothetical protein IPM37_23725 [Hahellaceae bacterium]|nr:hypothetical protein [Hahellaceae bacterium]